jgi:hypothetical protein
MKSFGQAFTKACGVRGRAPKNAVFLVLFLRLLAQKKNGESFLNVIYPNPFPAFFFDTAGAKKKAWQKRNAVKEISPSAEGDEGFAPSTCAAF